MATQSVIHPVGQSKVVPFSSPQAISQTELILFMSLRGRLQQLEEQVAAAQESLKTRLEARANTVFGDGKGTAYCDEVLASTEPTHTVTLVVR
jgi:hypothetical protein